MEIYISAICISIIIVLAFRGLVDVIDQLIKIVGKHLDNIESLKYLKEFQNNNKNE